MTTAPRGVGIGLRHEHYDAILACTRRVDWLEIVPENYVGIGGRPARVLDQCLERWPVLAHGVTASVGGPDPLDEDYLHGLRRLCDRLDAANKSPDWVGPGWYRVGIGLREFLNAWPPEDYACGGMAGSWHDGGWPLPSDGIVEHEICFAFGDDLCAWSVASHTVHCGSFRLWWLPDAPDCNLRYCMGYVIPD